MEQGQRPVPVEDIDTAPYWQAARRHRLELPCCNGCGSILFPPRARCPSCLSANLTWVELSGQGQVFSFTIVYVPVVRGIEPPYVVAQIELAEQPALRMTANILGCDPESVYIGMSVEPIFEELGDGSCLPQFRPASGETTAAP